MTELRELEHIWTVCVIFYTIQPHVFSLGVISGVDMQHAGIPLVATLISTKLIIDSI